MREQDIQRLIMLALSEAGCLIWRNNTGVLKNADGIPIRFGLAVGSSDLIGIAPGGRFLAVEKSKRQQAKQHLSNCDLWKAVRARGGIAGIARSPAEALALLAQ